VSTDHDDGNGQIKPFAATLQEIAAGDLHARLSEHLQQLVMAVTDTGKKGTLGVTLTVAPIKPGNVTNLVVSAKTTLKTPEGDEASAVFFTDKAGNLRRDDPNQPTLPLRELNTQRTATA
jgi:hypothetical protein